MVFILTSIALGRLLAPFGASDSINIKDKRHARMSTRWVALPNLEYAYRKLAKTKFIYVATTSHCGAGIGLVRNRFSHDAVEDRMVVRVALVGESYIGARTFADANALRCSG